MDAQLKAKWVEALRSGKYEQGRKKLFDGRGYCCLGVLCEVAGLQIVGGDRVVDDKHPKDGSYGPVLRLLGRHPIKGDAYDLTIRNDGGETDSGVFHQHSFAELADYIEANL